MPKALFASLLALTAALVVACSSAPAPEVEATSPPPDAPSAVQQSPTLDPNAVYRTPAEPISASNANRLAALGRLEAPSGRASSLFAHAVSLDGTRLAALNNDLLITWNLITGRILFITERAGATRIFISAEQDEVLAMDDAGIVTIYDLEQGEVKTDFEAHPSLSGEIAFYEDEGWLAVGGTDGTVKVWDTSARTSLVTLRAHNAPVLALAFSTDGERLATTGEDRLARTWSWRERTELASFDHIDSNPEQVQMSPDGQQVVTTTGQFIALWDVATGDLVYSLPVGRGAGSDILTYTQDGSVLASGGGVTDLLVLRAEDGTAIAQLPEVSGNRISGYFSPDGDLLLTTVLDRGVSLWNLAQATADTVPRATLDLGTRRITGATWTRDGFLMLFFDVNGVVYAWGIAEAE